ncbi:MAG TPA: hypothetical protein VI322_02535 [Candidatus Saccharimonadia bacterium]
MEQQLASPARPASVYDSNPFSLVMPAWEAFKLAWKPLVMLLLMIVGLVVAAGLVVVVMAKIMPLVGLVLSAAVVVAAIIGAMYVAWMNIAIMLAAIRGRRLELSEARPAGWVQPVKLFLTALLVGLTIVGGLILLIVPGIIFAVWFSYSLYVAVEDNVFGAAAMKRSLHIVKGHFWEVAAANALVGLVNMLYFIPFLGGLVILAVTTVLMPVPLVRYIQLKALPAGSRAETHPANYIVVIVAIIVNVMVNQARLHDLQSRLAAQELEKSSQAY